MMRSMALMCILLAAAGSAAEKDAPSSKESAAYDDYVGRYDYGGPVLTVTRDGASLKAQLTGQPPFEIFPKSGTTFAWKVVEAEVTFVRDADGKVTKAVHKQGGQTIDAPRLPDSKATRVAPETLRAYTGRYDYGQGGVMEVTLEGDRLFAQLTGQPKLEIFAKSETTFFWKEVSAELTFVKDASGAVVKGVHQQGGHTLEVPRLK